MIAWCQISEIRFSSLISAIRNEKMDSADLALSIFIVRHIPTSIQYRMPAAHGESGKRHLREQQWI